MRQLRFFFVIILITMATLFIFHPRTTPYPTPPRSPSCPIDISLSLQTDPADSGSNAWLNENRSSPPKISFFLHYKNVSDRPVLLSSGDFWVPDAEFECDSWLTKQSHIFTSINGELCWLILKPGESISVQHDLTHYLIFAMSGYYLINYTDTLKGSYYTGPIPATPNAPPNKITLDDHKKYSTGTFTAHTAGSLKIRITSKQSSWKW